MPLVTFKNLCLDANDVASMAGFWSRALDLPVEPLDGGEALLRGSEEAQTVWVNLVPEARTVKQRVHLDLRAESLEPFAGLEQVSGDGAFSWTTFLDPEGGEFCVFTYDEPPTDKLKSLVIDSADHVTISDWWADVIGGDVTHDESGYSPLENIPGLSTEGFDFVPVPEPKTVKNRIHWDVTLLDGATLDDLVTAGATVLDPAGDSHVWTVMADPEGNEFCVFPAA